MVDEALRGINFGWAGEQSAVYIINFGWAGDKAALSA